MKLTKYFMPFAALALLASCSNDKLDGPGAVEEQSKGDLYMSMTIRPVGNTETRTMTPNQGKETGQDYENYITSALIIFAENTAEAGNPAEYKIVESVYIGGINNENTLTPNDAKTAFTANFAVARKTLLEDIDATDTDSKVYYMFVIANAPISYADTYKSGADLQGKFTVASGTDNTFWGNYNFLMSNASVQGENGTGLTITKSQIDYGTHTTKDQAFNLGSVQVQRAMSRFDIDTRRSNLVFKASTDTSITDGADENKAGVSGIANVSVSFEAASMFNIMKEAYLYKVTASSRPANVNTVISLQPESYTAYAPGTDGGSSTPEGGNWVFTPDKTDNDWAWDYLFVSEEVENPDEEDAEENPMITVWKQKNLSLLDYDKLSTLSQNDQATWTQAPSDLPSTTSKDGFKIWRYAMENTNPFNVDFQTHNKTTGIIFRAKLSGLMADGGKIEEQTEALYAFNNVIYGTISTLFETVIGNPPTVDENNPGALATFEALKFKFNEAVKALCADGTKAEWTLGNYEKLVDKILHPTGTNADFADLTEDNLSALDTYLVANDFTIYRPSNAEGGGKEYLCYYDYWNRHNDNLMPTVMGIMEFSTVRNNVYKLRVSSVVKLGHPALPEDDPDPIIPDDPNEKDSFYCTIECSVLDWEIRVNEINF